MPTDVAWISRAPVGHTGFSWRNSNRKTNDCKNAIGTRSRKKIKHRSCTVCMDASPCHQWWRELNHSAWGQPQKCSKPVQMSYEQWVPEQFAGSHKIPRNPMESCEQKKIPAGYQSPIKYTLQFGCACVAIEPFNNMENYFILSKHKYTTPDSDQPL